MHVDAEFALRDTGCCDSKNIVHDPTNDNFSDFFLLYQQEDGSEIGYSTYFSRVLNEHFCFTDTALTRTMLLLSSDRWKYLHFAAESPSHIHLYTIYMERVYKVVLEENLRKYGLEFKKVKTTTRI